MNETIHHSGSNRIGYVLKRFPRFSETFILNELLELQRQGVTVEVFSLMRPPQEPRHAMLKSLRVPVTYLPRGGDLAKWKVSTSICAEQQESGITYLFTQEDMPFSELLPGKDVTTTAQLCLQSTTLAMLARSRGIKHLHAHFASNATTVALLAGRLADIPFSFTAHARDIYHTYVDPETDAGVRRRKIAAAEFVVTVSEYNRRYLSQLAIPGSAARIHRLYNGIDLSRFTPGSDSREADHFVAVGRLVEKKGFPYLIDACRLLRERGYAFRCTIIGDGPDHEALAGKISMANLENIVHLSGSRTQEQLLEDLKQATAVVLPSVVGKSGDRDGLPTVLLEAMAMGLPAISTKVAGIPEIIDNEKTGFLVPPNDSSALADALARLLDEPKLCQTMGEAGRLKAAEVFDLRCNVARLASLFFQSTARQVTDNEESTHAHSIRFG